MWEEGHLHFVRFGDHQVPGEDGVHSAEAIATASATSIHLIENLVGEWQDGVEVYRINMSSLSRTSNPEVVWMTASRGSLSSPSIFEQELVKDSSLTNCDNLTTFKWAPKFTDVKRTLEEGPPGTDSWALKMGYIGFVLPPHAC